MFFFATDVQKDLLLNCCGSRNTSATSSHTSTQPRPLTVLLQSHLMLPGSSMHSPDLVNRTPTVTVVTKGDKGNTRRIVSLLYLCKCYNIRPHPPGLLDLPTYDLCTEPQRDSVRSHGNKSIFTILTCDTAITKSWKGVWDGFPTLSQ